ncbi:MAG: ATP-binding cassette domain-containing protein [Dysgonamonadaceae bacterium]|jgi:ATPase subunit of ABC transporter with duplicated ATPase domains|nr:ATP-binding cassette domain-containing protein [Dysgonamonadaceae bacterium]
MSIIISDLSYHYPNRDFLFEHLNFSLEKQEKVSLVGDNGAGKSTLLRLIAGHLPSAAGSIVHSSPPCYIPQHTGLLQQNVAEMLRVGDKLAALNAILKGSVSQADYDTLADDWDIEAKCRSALDFWHLSHLKLDTSADSLSGGEKTKTFLAGLLIHTPDIILLDEPSNHLDESGRTLLYRYIEQSKATIVVVSHDINLLSQMPVTYELSGKGMKRYGGNYDFYKEQKAVEINALSEDIHAGEKALRKAGEKAREIAERQQKMELRGAKQQKKEGTGKAMMDKMKNDAEKSASRVKGVHDEIIHGSQAKLSELRQQKESLKELKIDFDNAALHSGKLLIETEKLNFAYLTDKPLWKMPLDFKLFSNDRIHITGKNGAGKTTLIQLLTGSLTPSCGEIKRADFQWIYLDQHYSVVNETLTVVQLAELYNVRHLAEHEVKLRLARFLFPADTWDKPCKGLSGGEKMRLYLCCLMIGNQTPDLIILDEPTNNLDLSSRQILIQTIKNYRGSLLVISHDRHFVAETGATEEWKL